MLPWSCPSSSHGLVTVPTSLTATMWGSFTLPVSRTTETTVMYTPNGNVKSGGSAEHGHGSQRRIPVSFLATQPDVLPR
jgi:hypothetical protein